MQACGRLAQKCDIFSFMAALLALISSGLWGAADYLAGNLSKRFPPTAVLSVTQIIGLIFGLILATATGAWDAQALGEGGYLLPGIAAGLAGYVGLICLYRALATGRMGVVSPISAMSGIVPVLYALIFLGERFSGLVTIGVVFALLGAFLASGPELSQGFPLKPIVLSVGAAVGFGTALTFMAQGSESSALMTMVSMRAATFFISVSILFRLRGTGGLGKPQLGLLIFIGVADFSANLILGIATTQGLVSLAMVLGSLYPIMTALLAYIFLKERLHRVQYVGIVSAVIGVAVIAAYA
jgi:drug/metabolite transporter (DMT)-like permease